MKMNASSCRPIGGVFGLGTGGSLAALYFKWFLAASGLRENKADQDDFRTIWTMDTVADTGSLARRAGGREVAFGPGEFYAPPRRSASELQACFARNARMLRWAAALEGCPGSTEEGAGGEPAIGAAALIADWDKVPAMLSTKLDNQRDAKRISAAVSKNQAIRADGRSIQVLLCSGFGGSGTSAAALVALELHRLLGMSHDYEIVLICAAPPTGVDADINKSANFVSFLRQMALATQAPGSVRVPLWQRDLVLTRPLISRLYVTSFQNEFLSLGREAVYAAMGQAAFTILEDQTGIDGFFRDFEAEAQTTDAEMGPRIFARHGASILNLDIDRAKAVITEMARHQVCQRLLEGAGSVQEFSHKEGGSR